MKNTLSPSEAMTLLTLARNAWNTVSDVGEHEYRVLFDTYFAFLASTENNMQSRYDDFMDVYNIIIKPKLTDG